MKFSINKNIAVINTNCVLWFPIITARSFQAIKFPIPLLNRLEKHYFTLVESMSAGEMEAVREIEKWIEDLTTIPAVMGNFTWNSNINLEGPEANGHFSKKNRELAVGRFFVLMALKSCTSILENSCQRSCSSNFYSEQY